MLLIIGALTILALIVLARSPRLYSRWGIEPWLFRWALAVVVLVYLIALLLTVPSIFDSDGNV
jgi:hypothetical protein